MDVKNKFVRNLDEEELENSKTDRKWFVLHFRLLNPNKLEKVRQVFNAASQFAGISLNNNLMAEPDILQTPI